MESTAGARAIKIVKTSLQIVLLAHHGFTATVGVGIAGVSAMLATSFFRFYSS
jgi:hypothetical protein